MEGGMGILLSARYRWCEGAGEAPDPVPHKRDGRSYVFLSFSL